MEKERYKRQLMLEGFSEEHQLLLSSSTALVAGIGGLGGTAALYLAMAGIGKMIFVHSGNLTLSNMNRQVLMKDALIGRNRVEQAKRTILELNPEVDIEIHDARIAGENAGAFFTGADIALSARPNFQERRTLHRLCIRNRVPVVEAAMNGMEGYLFNVIPHETPCLYCLYPADDPKWEELGFPVLGAVSGMLGCLMSIEAIKLLTGYGTPLRSHMLVFDTKSMEFRKLHIARDPACSVCSCT